MKKGIVVFGIAVLVGTATASWAVVNCKIVMKQLDMGRTVDEVMTTTTASEDEIKKCQEEAAAKKAEGAGQAGGDAAKKEAK